MSGQQHGLVVLDANDTIIRPAKLWCDLESAKEAEELSERFGFKLVPSFTITKLLWLRRHEPDNYARIAKVMLPHDYINYILTGKFTMEASDASGTGIFDAIHRRWDADRIAAVDPSLATWLPTTILGPDDRAGTLKPEVAAELGLPSCGIVVGPGGGDNAMSALGVGAVDPGVWILSLGTSGTLFGPSETSILDPTGIVCPFCDATGGGLPLLCTINCSEVVGEVATLTGRSHEDLTEIASEEEPGSSGVTYLPYLRGERTPCWPHATGSILGLQAGCLRPGLLYRAAMEGATFSLLAGFEQMKEMGGGVELHELRVVGGGSKNKLWRQMIADAFQVKVRFPVEAETAALGAALQGAAVALGVPVREFAARHQSQLLEQGVVNPNENNAALYARAFEKFVHAGKLLFAVP